MKPGGSRFNRTTYGFTIVELLIVIVVIAILAAITIVAYTGVNSRAVVASLNADLENGSKALKVFQAVNNSTYPTALDCSATPAAGSTCLKSSPGSSYQYTFANNGTSLASFCLSETNGTTSYYIKSDTLPTVGTCTITNYATNPALGTDAVGWASASVTSPARTSVPDLAGFGWSYAGTAGVAGSRVYLLDATGTLTAGQLYSVTYWAKATAGMTIGYQATDSTGTTAYNSIGTIGSATGSWQKVQFTFTASLTTWRVALRELSATAGTIALTGVIVTAGPTYYNYADGNTAGWTWSGTANDSTSSGPSV